jgi:tetratricopeptide (TPR) repeat protein
MSAVSLEDVAVRSRRLTPYRSRCAVLAWIVLLSAAGAGPPSASAQQTADALYADRENLESAMLAAEAWERQLEGDPRDFEAAWKLSRARYWLGGHDTGGERTRHYEAGIAVARRAVLMESARPEGHFWMAANMGALAESSGRLTGLRYRGDIKAQLETVLSLDPGYQEGSADRALGRWYMKVPRLFGGSDERAVEHLRSSLGYDPDSTASHFFLAETFVEMDRIEEARTELQHVLDAPLNPVWAPEDRGFKQKAQELLQQLR